MRETRECNTPLLRSPSTYCGIQVWLQRDTMELDVTTKCPSLAIDKQYSVAPHTSQYQHASRMGILGGGQTKSISCSEIVGSFFLASLLRNTRDRRRLPNSTAEAADIARGSGT